MSAHSTLLAFDFDGTLAPIHDDPDAVRLSQRASVLLGGATQMEGICVAVVSGRDADDLALRVNDPGVYLISSHGLDIRAPGGVVIRETPPAGLSLQQELRDEITASGLRLEQKKHAIALHWRGIPFQAIGPVVEMFRSWTRDAGLDLIEGRSVVEARVRGTGKEEALRWLASAIGAGRVVYAGDDLTDFGPLRFAAEHGRAVFVASSERVPPPGVTTVFSFGELVRLIREEVMM